VEITKHGFVCGRVQGVFFRAETQKMAVKLGIRGWVRNATQGRVEILICGSKTATDLMGDWLAIGPPLAKVETLELGLIDTTPVAGFHIRS